MAPQDIGSQKVVEAFWKLFISTKPEIIHTILCPGPPLRYDDPDKVQAGGRGKHAAGSYEAAREACIEEVARVVRTCHHDNEKFTDTDFNLYNDWTTFGWFGDCAQRMPSPYETDREYRDAVTECWKSHRPCRPSGVCRMGSTCKSPTFAQGVLIPQTTKLSYEQTAFGPSLRQQLHKAWTCLCSPKPFFPSVRDLLVMKLNDPMVFRGCVALRTMSIVLLLLLILRWSPLWFWGILWMLDLLLDQTRPTMRCDPATMFSSAQVGQGAAGDCWFLTGVAALCDRDDLLQRVCVTWDQECGVYGFVFHRDGSWFHTVVDDYLYHEDDDLSVLSGDKLYFAKCVNGDQMWLPLLEKAYAKVHGDYRSLSGGSASEAIEDLTGGVSAVIRVDGLMKQEQLWKELRDMNGSVHYTADTPDSNEVRGSLNGLAELHAYSIEGAYELPRFTFSLDPRKVYTPTRLVKLRNPWGEAEGLWQGAFSNGSTDWSTLSRWWLRKTHCDDDRLHLPIFYMTYSDFLNTFASIQRAKLHDTTEWITKQEWVKMAVSWIPQYNEVYFRLRLSQASQVTLVIAQLDNRYFVGLDGCRSFHLEFIVRRINMKAGDYIARSTTPVAETQYPPRSVSLEQQLEAGEYEVLVKITATDKPKTVEMGVGFCSVGDVIGSALTTLRPRKLQRLARNYDTAHRKLHVLDDGLDSDVEESGAGPVAQRIQQTHARGDDWGDGWGDGWGNAHNISAMKTVPATDDVRGSELSKNEGKKTTEPAALAPVFQEQPRWNVACGVGLRVISKDPEMVVSAHHRRNESPWDDDATVPNTEQKSGPPISVSSSPRKEAPHGRSSDGTSPLSISPALGPPLSKQARKRANRRAKKLQDGAMSSGADVAIAANEKESKTSPQVEEQQPASFWQGALAFVKQMMTAVHRQIVRWLQGGPQLNEFGP